MAKAVFHKHQRVFVRPVGTWASIEAVVPHWTKGLMEPLRIHYDVGLGREFAAEELVAEEAAEAGEESSGETWRVLRGRNKWQEPKDCGHHPFPGTYPIVVTNEKDWGGWRVPGAEYDLNPHRVEMQARIMANGLKLMHLVRRLVDFASEHHSDLPKDVMDIARDAHHTLQAIERNDPEADTPSVAAE